MPCSKASCYLYILTASAASEQWRVDFKVDEVVKEFVYSEAEEVSKLYKRYHHKTDKLGRPIYFEIFKQVLSSLAKQRKQMDLKKLMSVTSEERLVQHHVREYEKFTRYKLAACSKKAGKHLDQGFTVLDLQGIPLSSFPSVKRLGNEMSKISADNYPGNHILNQGLTRSETMGILFVINAPMLFTAVWSVIKGWLDEATVKKIHILGSSYKDKLLEWVDPENLPVQYGGTCTCDCLGGCGNADVGPWNDGTVEGYPNLGIAVLCESYVSRLGVWYHA